MPRLAKDPADYISALNINGLEGRMLRLPAPKNKKRELVFIYGSHSSLERWWGLALELNKLGALTMPDLPGLGGMTPLYKLGQQPNIDNMADYLATFIKLRYKNKKVTFVSMSLGFLITTRMLQKYPELVKKTDAVVSVVGFAHGRDFTFSKSRLFFYKLVSKVFARKWPAKAFKRLALNRMVLNMVYHRTHNAKEKFENMSGDEFKRTMDMEVKLWQENDIRTQFKHYLEMFSADLTNQRVNLPVYHVATKKDRYFNHVSVEEHLRRIYNEVEIFETTVPSHAPTVIATTKEAAPFIPAALKRRLNQKRR